METNDFKKCCANCEYMTSKIAITSSKPYCKYHRGFVTFVHYTQKVCGNWKKRNEEDFKMYGW